MIPSQKQAPEEPGRVFILAVSPEIDQGRFPIRRIVGESVRVEADIFAEGHDQIRAVLLHRREGDSNWSQVPMAPLGNDRWRGEFEISALDNYSYTVTGWVDKFRSWNHDFQKRVDAGQDVSVHLLEGAGLIEAAGRRASSTDSVKLQKWAEFLRQEKSITKKLELVVNPRLLELVDQYPDRSKESIYEKELRITADREKAVFSAWYEMFPRSLDAKSTSKKEHGTFKDCEKRLKYIAEMGFDVLYFPPIHPIGVKCRKGKNNSTTASADEPGSPWAIGSKEGGHKGIHPELGTLEDFKNLLAKAKDYGIEVALDIAFQCSADHPYLTQHPDWFRKRADGTMQYAENPPKKYEDIYPLNFETEESRELWEELKSIVLYWAEQGVKIFRVDNPHTKPLLFWEWLIAGVKKVYPETIFLSEAFTRPKIMYALAKCGFTQSYTYFTWRNNKWELTDYFNELTKSDVREFFRPNLWPNTPDILHEFLQSGGRPAFMIRLGLAATLGASYGIYGPAYELCLNTPREPGSEEYLDSEKYEIKHWDLDQSHSLKTFISRVNQARKENPALHGNHSLFFHTAHNDSLICYSKRTQDYSNVILTVVNLDPHHTQSGWLDLNLQELGIEPDETYQLHDLVGEARFIWQGGHNFVELNPGILPIHIFRLRKKVRTERDFSYFT